MADFAIDTYPNYHSYILYDVHNIDVMQQPTSGENEMLITMLLSATVAQVLTLVAVLAFGGGWFFAVCLALGAGCAAVLGAGLIGSGSQHIHENAGAGRAA